MQLELGHEEAVEHAHRGADAHGDQDDHGDGQGADFRPHLVGGGDRLEQGRGDTGGQAHAAAGGQVGAGQHDTAGDAQGQRQIGRRLGQNVDEGTGLEEVGIDDLNDDHRNNHQDVQRVVQ